MLIPFKCKKRQVFAWVLMCRDAAPADGDNLELGKAMAIVGGARGVHYPPPTPVIRPNLLVIASPPPSAPAPLPALRLRLLLTGEREVLRVSCSFNPYSTGSGRSRRFTCVHGQNRCRRPAHRGRRARTVDRSRRRRLIDPLSQPWMTSRVSPTVRRCRSVRQHGAVEASPRLRALRQWSLTTCSDL